MRSCETNKVSDSTHQNVCLNCYHLFDREVKGISFCLPCRVLSLFPGNSLCTCIWNCVVYGFHFKGMHFRFFVTGGAWNFFVYFFRLKGLKYHSMEAKLVWILLKQPLSFKAQLAFTAKRYFTMTAIHVFNKLFTGVEVSSGGYLLSREAAI